MNYRTLLIKTRTGSYRIAPWTRGEDGVMVLQDEPIEIQSLVFDKGKGWDAEKAVTWAKEHDFKYDKVDEPEGGETIRLRQFEPDLCKPDTYASWPMEGVEGVTAVGCRKKASEEGFELTDLRARTAFGLVRQVEGDTVAGMGSFASTDRYKELVKPESFAARLDTFKRHPVMLLGHENMPQIELPIGDWRKEVKITEDGLYLEGELMPEHRRYAEVHAAVARRLLALSIGFIPIRGHEASDEELAKYGGGLRYVWDEVELLEVSLVSIPANRDTLAALKAMATRECEQTVTTLEWQASVRQLQELDAKLANVRRRAAAISSKNWGPHVEKIKTLSNQYATDLTKAVEELEGFLADALGPAEEPDGEPPAGPADGEPEGSEDMFKALHALKETTEKFKA